MDIFTHLRELYINTNKMFNNAKPAPRQVPSSFSPSGFPLGGQQGIYNLAQNRLADDQQNALNTIPQSSLYENKKPWSSPMSTSPRAGRLTPSI
jgi:hypothetical protein